MQHAPERFKVLRVLIRRHSPQPRDGAKFLLLGSASPALLRRSSVPLAAVVGGTKREAAPAASGHA